MQRTYHCDSVIPGMIKRQFSFCAVFAAAPRRVVVK